MNVNCSCQKVGLFFRAHCFKRILIFLIIFRRIPLEASPRAHKGKKYCLINCQEVVVGADAHELLTEQLPPRSTWRKSEKFFSAFLRGEDTGIHQQFNSPISTYCSVEKFVFRSPRRYAFSVNHAFLKQNDTRTEYLGLIMKIMILFICTQALIKKNF